MAGELDIIIHFDMLFQVVYFSKYPILPGLTSELVCLPSLFSAKIP